MKDLTDDHIGSTNVNMSALSDDPKVSLAWSTEKIDKLINDYEEGIVDIREMFNSPFINNDVQVRRPKLQFEYTKDERDELRKCAADPLYFAEHFAYAMTDDGLQILKYRDYQQQIINTIHQSKFSILMASRQIGKTITTATFIVWFLIFNKDKNALVVADVMDTTKELIDKMKNIILNLPFYMKPGLVINNVMMLKFDNGSRILGRTTTKKTGIGFNIHLLYMDEFAHIDDSFLGFFYRSIYPTISAMPNSKVIITSTPSGVNRFYRLWMDAIEKKNTYVPMRVDWWQVPGRDEKWREETIANLGSEEDFNQEYGLQFFSGDTLLMSASELRRMNRAKTTYEAFKSELLTFDETDYSRFFRFHPNFVNKNLTGNVDLRHDTNYYVLSVDTGDGLGRDYSVINIYKVVALPLEILKKHRTFIKEDHDVVGLVQVGIFRCNTANIDAFCEIAKNIIFKFFNPQYVRVVIELNHKGERVHDKMKTHGDYWSGMVVFSRHRDGDKYMSPGIILTNEKVKDKYCEDFRYYVVLEKIIPNEFFTVEEISGLGKTKVNGSYRSQSGNDDCAISSVNISTFFKSPQFHEVADDVVMKIADDAYITAVKEEFIEYNLRMDAKDTGMEASYITSLNNLMS